MKAALFSPETPKSLDNKLGAGGNIFKFKTGTRQPLHSLLPFSSDDHLQKLPVKAPRKFPARPFKVLNAPGLEDDFYSNLVDLVCNLAWSKNVNELVSTHGYSQNQIIVWRFPAMTKLATLTGHAERVLDLAISPDGKTIVTGEGDEKLQFWKVFPSARSQIEFGVAVSGRTQIS
ncbi:hypothetical protein ACET3Z_008533 [Daucus carota]